MILILTIVGFINLKTVLCYEIIDKSKVDCYVGTNQNVSVYKQCVYCVLVTQGENEYRCCLSNSLYDKGDVLTVASLFHLLKSRKFSLDEFNVGPLQCIYVTQNMVTRSGGEINGNCGRLSTQEPTIKVCLCNSESRCNKGFPNAPKKYSLKCCTSQMKFCSDVLMCILTMHVLVRFKG